jgi:hypothetical protein
MLLQCYFITAMLLQCYSITATGTTGAVGASRTTEDIDGNRYVLCFTVNNSFCVEIVIEYSGNKTYKLLCM